MHKYFCGAFKYHYQLHSKSLLLISMKMKNCILFLWLLQNIYSLHNLVADSGFESLNANLSQVFSGTQSYTYRIMPNGQSSWYSAISGGILVRESMNTSTTVIDSVNNNSHEKICQDFRTIDSMPYQLSFDSFIDDNIGWARLAVQFNGFNLFYGYVINKIPLTQTYHVQLTQSVNVLCFEGWASASQSSKIGALIDNVVLAPIDVRYINFEPTAIPTELNIINLISNETVINESELVLFKTEVKLQIPNLEFNMIQVKRNQKSKLVIEIEIKNQYASSQTQPTITLPEHRNLEGQIILYYTSSSILPRYLYSSSADNEIVSESYFYLIILVKIYNVIYRVIKIIGFAFVGIRFLGGFYLLLFLGFLDLEFIMPIVRNAIQEFMTLTINTQTINYFVFLTRHQIFDYGAGSIPIEEKFLPRNSSGVEYSSTSITPNVYSLIIDDLFIAIFNTLKIVVLYHLVFKESKRFMKILKRVKNQKIFLQYITLSSVVILATGICWRGQHLVNFYGKINRAISFLIPIVSTFLCLIIFINSHNNMIKEYNNARRKTKKKMAVNENMKKYYQSQICISLVENLMLIIVPALIGLGFIYLSLSVFLLMILLKLKLMIKGLRNNHKLINFFWFISYLIQFSLVAFFMMANLLESFPNLSSSSEITWMIILKYNSVGLLFLYTAVGFIETVCSIINFVEGLMALEFSCTNRTNKIQNEFNENQIKVEEISNGQFLDSTGIKVLNQLKEKVQKASNSISSTEKIANPFIKSSESIPIEIQQSKQKNQAQTKQEKKPAERSKTKVITMKNIESEEFKLQPVKSQRPKSADQQENQQKSKKEKKPMQQKNLKLIKKLQISFVKQQEPHQEPDTLKHMVVSNFEKQENFS